MRSLNKLTLMMVLKFSASSLSASSVSLRTLPIPRRRHSFATPWTGRTIRAFKKGLPLEAPTFSFGLLTARKHPTRCSNISPDDVKKRGASRTLANLASETRDPVCQDGVFNLIYSFNNNLTELIATVKPQKGAPTSSRIVHLGRGE